MNLPTTVVSVSGLLLRLDELVKQHGSVRAAARVLKIDHAYIKRLKDGTSFNPSDSVLKKLGLRRMVQFTPNKKARTDGQ